MEQAVPLQGDWLNFNRFAVRAEKTMPIGPLRCSPGRCGSGAGAGAPCVVGGAGGQQQQQQEEQAWAAACRRAGPATPHHRPHLHSRRVWARGKGGMIVGDLPAYEAFPIGGTNSVRGYSEGACCRGGLDRPGAGRPAPSSPGCPGLPSPRRAGPCVHAPARLPAGGVGSGRNFVAGSAELRVPLVSPLEATVFADWGSDLDSGTNVPGDPAGARGKPGAMEHAGQAWRALWPVALPRPLPLSREPAAQLRATAPPPAQAAATATARACG